jgi:hypothetical protein
MWFDQFGDVLDPTKKLYAFGEGSRKRPCLVQLDPDGEAWISFGPSKDFFRASGLTGQFVRVDFDCQEIFYHPVISACREARRLRKELRVLELSLRDELDARDDEWKRDQIQSAIWDGNVTAAELRNMSQAV